MPPPAVGGGLRQASGARRVTIASPGRGRRGAFGERLITGPLETTRLDIIVGRTRRAWPPSSRVATTRLAWSPRCASPPLLNTRRVTPAILGRTGAFAVVDAAGSYQGGDYGLAQAAIAAGPRDVDLADARDFVAGFGPAVDDAARAAGVVALTGASSTPALSNTALDTLTAGWRRVDRVEIAISLGNPDRPGYHPAGFDHVPAETRSATSACGSSLSASERGSCPAWCGPRPGTG